MKPKKYIDIRPPHLQIPLWWPSLPKAWLPSRGNVIFTLIIAGLLVLAQSVGALPLSRQEAAQSAASTSTIAYQGRLADSEGAPLTGTYSMIFRLYDAASGGTPLWEEQWTGSNGVAVSDGLFNVMLGSLNSVPPTLVTSNSALWLGITVGTDDEMSPRIQLGSVPFAVQALNVPDGSVTTAKIADGTILSDDLASGIVVPIGTMISWWRPDANTPLPSGEWAIADGSMVTDSASPYNGKTLPDLRNRFVMGVTAANIGQMGGANTLNLAHQHLVDSHAHSLPSHNHGAGDLMACIMSEANGGWARRISGAQWETNASWDPYGWNPTVAGTTGGTDIVGTSDYWSGTSGATQPNTNYQLSSSVDNRPQYVGLVYLVKIK